MKKSELHPRNWKSIKKQEVIKVWREKLEPLILLPEPWEKYVLSSVKVCMGNEIGYSSQWEALYKNYVSIRFTDITGKIFDGSGLENVFNWLESEDSTVLFILGDFGDGKTFFTYVLSRILLDVYREKRGDSYIPIRLALKNYNLYGNPRDFLKGRLSEFGAKESSWNELKANNKLLIILDGFDEISKELDPETISKNIKILVGCCEEFSEIKTIITSRRHFFENNRDVQRLLERLNKPIMRCLAPLEIDANKKHLESIITDIKSKEKLNKLYEIHDILGLSSKPLFLQMIKETIDELPEETLNGVSLYEAYINKSLKRKIDQLDDENLKSLPYSEIIPGLINILENIAIKLQITKSEFIYLSDFQNITKYNFAKILWNTSGHYEEDNSKDKVMEKDAVARVSVRSLLARINSENSEKKWPVSFCHRSMQEYFVAKKLFFTLRNDIVNSLSLLEDMPLNYEILKFTADLIKGLYRDECIKTLHEIIKNSKISNKQNLSGGHAATLLFMVSGQLQGDDWSSLNIDYCNLSGADLSKKNFSKSTLRYSILDNVDFTDSDFRNCDLTGVKIEETGSVTAITNKISGNVNYIFVAYTDNSIREWKIISEKIAETKIIYNKISSPIVYLFSYSGFDLTIITNNNELIYLSPDINRVWSCVGKFKIKSSYNKIWIQKEIAILLSEKDNFKELILIDFIKYKMIDLINLSNFHQKIDIHFSILSVLLNSLCNIFSIKSDYNYLDSININSFKPSCIDMLLIDDTKNIIVALGGYSGEILILIYNYNENKLRQIDMIKDFVHDDTVTSIKIIDEYKILSGGMDKKVAITGLNRNSNGKFNKSALNLYRSVKCKGMKIEGLKGKNEYNILKELIQKV